MPAPVSPEIRALVASSIRHGMGRNEIARVLGISTGTVTNIARAEGLHFDNDWMTTAGTEAHRTDCEIARIQRESKLLDEYLALPTTFRQRNGRETKASRRLSYQLYDINRHHSRR